jgi:hypothetical protein
MRSCRFDKFRLVQRLARDDRPDLQGRQLLALVATPDTQSGLAVVKALYPDAGNSEHADGMAAEVRVYTRHINPLIDAGHGQNLVRCLQHGLCPSDALARLGARPGAGNMSTLVTEVPPGHVDVWQRATLVTLLQQRGTDARLVKSLIFQALFTLALCHRHGIAHHDSHLRNWLVGVSRSGGEVTYRVDDEHVYAVPGGAVLYLFDWDQGYVVGEAPNKRLAPGGRLCATWGICNSLRPFADMFRLLCAASWTLQGGCGYQPAGLLAPLVAPFGGYLNRSCGRRGGECAVLTSDNIPADLTYELLTHPFFDDLRRTGVDTTTAVVVPEATLSTLQTTNAPPTQLRPMGRAGPTLSTLQPTNAPPTQLPRMGRAGPTLFGTTGEGAGELPATGPRLLGTEKGAGPTLFGTTGEGAGETPATVPVGPTPFGAVRAGPTLFGAGNEEGPIPLRGAAETGNLPRAVRAGPTLFGAGDEGGPIPLRGAAETGNLPRAVRAGPTLFGAGDEARGPTFGTTGEGAGELPRTARAGPTLFGAQDSIPVAQTTL